MADNEVKVKISAEDQLSPVMKKAIENMAEMHSSTINLAAGLEIVKTAGEYAYEAFEKIEHQLERAIEAALEAEKAQNQLKGAMASTGQYTREAYEELDKYIETAQKTVGADGEVMKTMIAKGVQMGLTVEKSKQMEEAARKLAAANGIDLQEAFGRLSMSLNGNARGLALLMPQVKEFGQAQLKNGAAIDMINSKLEAQYGLYQQSLPAALDRAKVGIGNVYTEIGKLITESPLAQQAVKAFSDLMFGLAEEIKSVGEWLKEHQAEVGRFMDALGKAAIVLGVVAGAMAIATYGASAFGAALAFATGPIGLTILGVTALVAAFYKWPPLADIVIGSMKTLAGMMLTVTTGPLMLLIKGMGMLVSMFDKDLGKAMEKFADDTANFSQNLTHAGMVQTQFGVDSLMSSEKVVEGKEKEKQAHKDAYEEASKQNAKMLAMAQTFAGFSILTQKQRDQLQLQVEDRDKDMQRFQQYLEAKKRLAISAAAEQQAELHKVQSKEMGDTGGGGEGAKAKAQVEIDTETRKQAELTMERQKGLLSRQQYEEASFASQQRMDLAKQNQARAHAQALAEALGETPDGYAQKQALKDQAFELEVQSARARAAQRGADAEQQQSVEDQLRQQHYVSRLAEDDAYYKQQQDLAFAHQQQMANLLGESEEGYALKQQMEEERFQQDLERKMERADEEGASQEEIYAIREDAEAQHRQRMLDLEDQHYAAVADREEISGQTITATREKYLRQQEQAQSQSVKQLLSGTTAMVAFQQAAQQTTAKIGQSMIQNQGMTANAMVGMFLEALGTQVQQKGFADMIMGIFPPNPVQIGLGAAEVALGTGIGRLGVSMQHKNSGGKMAQSHGGIDEIPQSMDNKTFTLSAGERVIQPTANKDLTAYLDAQKNNGGSSSSAKATTVNITINGEVSKDQARKSVDLIIQELRAASERGVPIISEKGVVKNGL